MDPSEKTQITPKIETSQSKPAENLGAVHNANPDEKKVTDVADPRINAFKSGKPAAKVSSKQIQEIQQNESMSASRKNIKVFLDHYKDLGEAAIDYLTLEKLKENIDRYEDEIEKAGFWRSFTHSVSKIFSSRLYYVSDTQKALDIYEKHMPAIADERQRILANAEAGQAVLESKAQQSSIFDEKEYLHENVSFVKKNNKFTPYSTSRNIEDSQESSTTRSRSTSSMASQLDSDLTSDSKSDSKVVDFETFQFISNELSLEEVELNEKMTALNNRLTELKSANKEFLVLKNELAGFYEQKKSMFNEWRDVLDSEGLGIEDVYKSYNEYGLESNEDLKQIEKNIEMSINKLKNKQEEIDAICDKIRNDTETVKLMIEDNNSLIEEAKYHEKTFVDHNKLLKNEIDEIWHRYISNYFSLKNKQNDLKNDYTTREKISILENQINVLSKKNATDLLLKKHKNDKIKSNNREIALIKNFSKNLTHEVNILKKICGIV